MKANYKRIISLSFAALALFVTERATAQQQALFTQYTQNPLTVNPAYAGSNDALNVVALSRIQWTGFDGAPKTTSLTIHSPVQGGKIGAGLTILNDKIGPENSTGFFADFSYKLQLGTNSNLRLGLRAGGSVYSAKLGDLDLVKADDPAFASNISGKFLPNFGFGAYFNTDKFFAGFSVPKLLSNQISFNDGLKNTTAYTERQHIFLIAGGLFPLTPNLKIKPSVGLRYVVGAPASVDLTANFLISEKIWLGAFHRIKDSFGGIVQLQVTEQFRFGYSYDYTTSKMRTYNNGTHEIMLSYDFIFKRSNIKSPRYF
jgi:type IX secretion system PorP/SprF family membrane protein